MTGTLGNGEDAPKADEIRGLVKGGFLNGSSVGFEVVDSEPVDARNPRKGRRVTRWNLLEFSFVAVPADPGALVTARAAREADGLPSEAQRILREALGQHDLGEIAHKEAVAHHRRCATIVRSVLRGDRGTIGAGAARSLRAALGHHDEAIAAHADAGDELADFHDIVSRALNRAVPSPDNSSKSAGTSGGGHGAYAAILDPSTPPHIRAELRAARHVAAVSGGSTAVVSLDYERRQADLRRLKAK